MAIKEHLQAANIAVGAVALNGVYDEPPTHPPFPYALIGEFRSERNDLLDIVREEHTGEIHVYTREPERSYCDQFCAGIAAALHRAELTVAECAVIATLVESYYVIEDPQSEPRTRQYHGIVAVRVLTRPV